MDQLITLAGGKNVGAGLTSSWAQISVEELLAQNPDFILLGDAAYGTTVDQVKAREGWDKIKAVQDGNIFAFNDDLVSRAGPRLVQGLEELAKTIHPELFK
jgi:iron complex transport system substrate-binding protein